MMLPGGVRDRFRLMLLVLVADATDLLSPPVASVVAVVASRGLRVGP